MVKMDQACENYKLIQRNNRLYDSMNIDPHSSENKNTKRKTETDMRIFTAYLVSLNETREPESIPPEELDRHLATYFSIIKKHDGNEYEPASLRGMLCSIERYLRSRNYPISLTRDAEFLNTRNMLKEKQKILRELAKTEKSDKHESLASLAVQRLNQLYLAKEFGPHNATSVVNALCFSFVVHLKIKKAIDHKQLLWGDIVLSKTASEEEYLCYKPLPGYEYCRLPLKGISHQRVCMQMHNTPLWDPITIYKLYSSKRPPSMTSPGSPFYLGVAASPQDNEQQSWYKPVSVGVNKLNDLVRMIRDITGSLPGNQSFFSPIRTEISDDQHHVDTSYHVRFSHPNDHVETPSETMPTSACAIAKSPDAFDGSMKTEAFREDQSEYRYAHIQPTQNQLDNADAVGESGAIAECGKGVLADDRSGSAETQGENAQDLGTDNEEDDSNDVESNEFETAKQKILTILANLDDDSKQAVTAWLRTLHVDTDTGDIREGSLPKMEFNVTFEVDANCLTSKATQSSVANIQIKTPQKQPTCKQSSPETSRQHGSMPVCSTAPTIASDKVWQSIAEAANRTRASTEPNSLKRTLSQPGDHSVSKIAKIDGHADKINSVIPCSQEAASTRGTTPSERHENGLEVVAHQHVMTPSPNIAYASWPYDPRLALFLRNDFIQTYQNLIEMYNVGAVKDARKMNGNQP